MKANLFLPLTFLTLMTFGCSPSIKFGITQEYLLSRNEKETPLTKDVLNKYEKIIASEALSLPLNKHILSQDYSVFIGVSFEMSALDIFNEYKKKSTIIQSQENFSEFFYKQNNQFFYSFLFTSEKDKMTYMLTLNSDSSTTLKKYNSHFLKTKAYD